MILQVLARSPVLVQNAMATGIVQDRTDWIALALALGVTPAYGPVDEQFLPAELRERRGGR